VLDARHIRLERRIAPARPFSSDLYHFRTFAFDPRGALYGAGGRPAYAIGTRLRATLRLHGAQGVHYIRFDNVTVAPSNP
jgi:hypothetical protein